MAVACVRRRYRLFEGRVAVTRGCLTCWVLEHVQPNESTKRGPGRVRNAMALAVVKRGIICPDVRPVTIIVRTDAVVALVDARFNLYPLE
jgi:hypothetical protein